MFDITTGTGDFIANGVVSHNCFARNTHTYLDLDAGHDFDSKVIVKVNAGELLRRELAAPRWRGAHIAMGTNVDCYQRAEGRYRLMPQIIARAARLRQPVLHPHQGHADHARPAAAAPGGGGDRGGHRASRSASWTSACGAAVEPGRRARGAGWTRFGRSPTPASRWAY